MHGSLGDDVGVQAVAEVDGVDVVAVVDITSASGTHIRCRGGLLTIMKKEEEGGGGGGGFLAYHSRSLYMIVKKTCRNRLTAFISTANRKSHASPDILSVFCAGIRYLVLSLKGGRWFLRRDCASEGLQIWLLQEAGIPLACPEVRLERCAQANKVRSFCSERSRTMQSWYHEELIAVLLCVAVMEGQFRVVEGAWGVRCGQGRMFTSAVGLGG